MAVNHIVSLPNYNRQEMTLVSKEEFLSRLDAKESKLVASITPIMFDIQWKVSNSRTQKSLQIQSNLKASYFS